MEGIPPRCYWGVCQFFSRLTKGNLKESRTVGVVFSCSEVVLKMDCHWINAEKKWSRAVGNGLDFQFSFLRCQRTAGNCTFNSACHVIGWDLLPVCLCIQLKSLLSSGHMKQPFIFSCSDLKRCGATSVRTPMQMVPSFKRWRADGQCVCARARVCVWQTLVYTCGLCCIAVSSVKQDSSINFVCHPLDRSGRSSAFASLADKTSFRWPSMVKSILISGKNIKTQWS